MPHGRVLCQPSGFFCVYVGCGQVAENHRKVQGLWVHYCLSFAVMKMDFSPNVEKERKRYFFVALLSSPQSQDTAVPPTPWADM